MKLVYKGKFVNEDSLPKGILPESAVKFKEPGTLAKLTLYSSIFVLPALLLVCLFMAVSSLLHGGSSLVIRSGHLLIGFLLSALTLLPHELLHAVCFGKDAEVELYIAPKQLAAFVISTRPISKGRFIFLSLLPNLVFGWIPLAIWALLPYLGAFSDVLFIFSVMSVMLGVGDYLNVFNAARQMPKGSMQQLSGFNSYWFMKE